MGDDPGLDTHSAPQDLGRAGLTQLLDESERLGASDETVARPPPHGGGQTETPQRSRCTPLGEGAVALIQVPPRAFLQILWSRSRHCRCHVYKHDSPRAILRVYEPLQETD